MQDSSSGGMLLWSGDALHEVSLSNEGKDMWRTYLDYQVWGLGGGVRRTVRVLRRQHKAQVSSPAGWPTSV